VNMKRLKTRLVLLVVCCLVGSAAWAQNVIYVNAIAAGASNGSSWTDAFKDLQDAINLANPGDEIWVAAGTYRPRRDINGVFSPTSRFNTFYFNKDVAVYGGFQGTETALIQRVCNPASPTILSGDLGTLGDATDNTLHVCYAENLTDAFLLDCITIADGYGRDGINYTDGGGWYNDALGGISQPSFNACIFLRCFGGKGGAFYNNGTNGGTSSPQFVGCEFRDNLAQAGAAIYNDGGAGEASPTVARCTFTDNIAGHGGAIYNNGGSGVASGIVVNSSFISNDAKIGAAVYQMADGGTTRGEFTRCLFQDNIANDYGGAVGSTAVQGDAKTTFTDCMFERNRANSLGGAIWNHGASPWFVTCIFLRNNSGNNGGAMYNDGANGLIANPRITSCEFSNNSTTNNGGAMYNQAVLGDASPVVVLSTFIINRASAGGAIYNDGSGNAIDGRVQATYYNCLFSRNSSVGRGAVAYNIADGGSCTPAFASCSFAGNTAGVGSLFYLNQLNGGTCTVSTYNMASHGHAGTVGVLVGGSTIQAYGGMYEASLGAVCNGTCYVGGNPMFTNPAADDLTLQVGSPAINVGLNAWYLPQYPVDLAGNTRLQGGTIDLGAYETPTLPPPPPCPRVIYVNKIAPGLNNGTSWANAYRDLQDALTEARINPCTDTILIAAGTYLPTTSTNVNIGFELVNDIEMYGGFPNTGNPWFPNRDLVAHETILSGDIGVPGNTYDNSLGVITVGGLAPLGPTNVNDGTIVDGLSIVKGVTGYLVTMYQNSIRCETVFRDVRFYDNYSRLLRGPAIHIFIPNTATYSPIIMPIFERCQIENNRGDEYGGFGVWSNLASTINTFSPKFRDCRFAGNRALRDGGAVYLTGNVFPVFDRCVFDDNQVTGTTTQGASGGGAIEVMTFSFTNPTSRTAFNNCRFTNNRSSVAGGVLLTSLYANGNVRVDFNNCTFAGSRAFVGGLSENQGAGFHVVSFRNCVIWDSDASWNGDVINATGSSTINFDHCLIDAASCAFSTRMRRFGAASINCGPGMIFNQNPLFLNPTGGNYRLATGSPAINAGSNALVPVGITTDLAGNDRIHIPTGGIVDMGCYENFPGMLRPAVYVNTATPVLYHGYVPNTALLESLVDGGTAPYTYAWSTGETTANITVSPALTTTYSLTVTDALGDTLEGEITITVLDVACTRPNGQPGVIVCSVSGQTQCANLNAVAQMLESGAATLGPCGGPLKQMELAPADDRADASVVIYPNPATDVLHLDYTAGSFGEGEIIDQMGRVVARIAVDATTVDVSSLADGIYLLRLFSGDHVVTRRFVKE
jgi:hypothetical protein